MSLLHTLLNADDTFANVIDIDTEAIDKYLIVSRHMTYCNFNLHAAKPTFCSCHQLTVCLLAKDVVNKPIRNSTEFRLLHWGCRASNKQADTANIHITGNEKFPKNISELSIQSYITSVSISFHYSENVWSHSCFAH